MSIGHTGPWPGDYDFGSEAELPAGTTVKVSAVAVRKADSGVDVSLDRGSSNQIANTSVQTNDLFGSVGAITPPLDPEFLCWLFEHSSAWRQNVDAYATNIDGFGHRLDPIIDLDAEDSDERIADLLYQQRLTAGGTDQVLDPTPEEISACREQLKREMRRERLRLETFLQYACLDHSFVTLRRRMRQDLEVTGNAFWEVIRNQAGEVAEFLSVPAYTIRMRPLDEEPIEVTVRIKTTDIDYGEVTTRRSMRRFVQVFGSRVSFFKEFGDTRPISRTTGQVRPLDLQGRPMFEPGDGPANELVHFKIHSPRSSYGVTRYAGNILTMLGLRESEEVNRDYFENKAVPPLLLMIAGAEATEEMQRQIEEAIENAIKGKKNFHRILIVGAAPANNGSQTARVSMHAQPLTDAQLKDAIFGQYDIRCMDKNGFTARLPRMLRGDVQDVNRASADASLVFAEAQVFAPERGEFDDWMNRKLFADMGIRFWRFVSNGPMPRDSAAMADLITKAVQAGIVTINEARAAGADVFNHPLPELTEDWADMPLPLVLRSPVPIDVGGEAPGLPGAQPQPPQLVPPTPKTPPELPPTPETAPAAEPPAAKGAHVDIRAWARQLLALRDAMVEEECDQADAAFRATKAP